MFLDEEIHSWGWYIFGGCREQGETGLRWLEMKSHCREDKLRDLTVLLLASRKWLKLIDPCSWCQD